MSPQQRWKRIQELCEQAEGVPASDRAGLLSTAEPDASIRAEVLTLLGALAGEAEARSELQSTSEPPVLPQHIGAYRVTGVLGRGGTSTVYAGERETEGITSGVAIKVLHAFLLDDESTARFQREQRILARLDHPALCRVLDAGITVERQPFLVLERVDGQPIDEYAREQKLSVAERVRLVMAAAEAVGAAHTNFVAHLDLKPGNMYVTAAGHVRLLDFGTAKLLIASDTLTRARHLTPVYASPEQLRGDPVTMASDIYSLGLILYELLTGAPAFAEKSLVSLAERAAGSTSTRSMAGNVTEDAAAERGLTATRLRKLLSGDIERVVAKALAPEPEQRYATAAELSDDLRRYLEDRPVQARPQTAGYRFKKYAARNRGALSVTVLLVVGLLGAAGYAFWQQRQAIAAGNRAQVSASFLMWLISSSNPLYGGSPSMTVLELVNRAEERLRRGDVLDRELSVALEAHLGAFMYNAGQQQRGAALVGSSLEQARKSANPGILVLASGTLGGMLLSQGDCTGAVKVLQEGDAVLARQRSSVPTGVRISFLISRDQVKADCEQDQSGRLTAEAIALLPSVPDSSTDLGLPPRIWKALAYNAYARALLKQRKLAESREATERGLQMAAQEPDGRNIRIALLQTRAVVEYAEKDVAAAANSLAEAATLAEVSASPFEAIRLKVMAGQRLAEAGQKTRALALADQALEQAELRSSEIAQTKWMILIDAAFTYFNADHCEKVGPLVKQADALTGGKMPPQWKGNRLAVETMCLAKAGQTAQAKALGAQALAAAGASWSSSSGMRKRIEAIVGAK